MKFMTIAVVAVYLVTGYFFTRSLVKRKYWRELVSGLVILTFGFALLALQALDVKIPSPGEGIRIFVENFLHLGYK